MGKYYDVSKVTSRVADRVVYDGNEKAYFKQGNLNEVITSAGENVIKSKIKEALNEDREAANDQARELLVQKHTYLKLRNNEEQNSEEYKNYNKKVAELQTEFEKASSLVREIELYLENFK
ncbi:hypothetical protein J14TS2_17130 [Bacillus sp. J14TS2]|uniref:hypothetical protein n=1 Tax=Bacillus sp. J14TS2 TaxID=2807188 RepID=UPI001B0535F9|nr:hypothetical protein [Bacillus sp. J14TS2]GIN71238.1 hypothetical protein J14TS2_17130 [Bacillus sp. J14TS2]